MRFTKSIRWRLLIWIAVCLSIILAVLDFTACKIDYSDRVSRLDEELQHRVAVLSATLYAPVPAQPVFGNRPPSRPDEDFGPPPDGGPPSGGPPDQNGASGPPPERPGLDNPQITAAARRFAVDMAAGFYFCIWEREAAAPFEQSTNCPAGILRPPMVGNDTGTYPRTRGTCREVFHTTELGDCVLVGRTLAPEIAAARRFAALQTMGSLAVLAFGLGGAWFIIGRALRPVEKISAAARHIADGNLSERINAEETESELGQLAGVLNSTFARLESAFVQQRQFTADASHELRTPLAVLISEAQTTLSRERSAGEYREAVAACLDTAQQMRRLTESLLELARLDAGEEVFRREKINLAALAQDGVKLVRPLAAARGIEIHCDLAPAELPGDADRLKQVVTNLLTNAVRYNRDGGKILVATRVENGAAMLSVADTGRGISAADLPHIFERFYRGDKSRTGAGAGLGLSICKAMVEAHGGAIEVAGGENSGATFTVRLPAAGS